jgi:hypothetical protein
MEKSAYRVVVCTGLDALKNLVTFKEKLALPLFFSNSRSDTL